MIVEFFKKRSNLLGIFISLIYFLILLFTLKDYGINADSPFHFLRGQALLQKLITGKDYFDQPAVLTPPVLFYPGERISSNNIGISAWEEEMTIPKKIENFDGTSTIQERFLKYQSQVGRQSFYKHNAWGPAYFAYDDGPGHPPISDILSAIANRIFYERLGILGDIETYQFYAILTAVFTVLTVYLFVYSIWGLPEALFSTITLALYPTLFAISHSNIKDIPEMAFFTSSVITFYFWVIEGRKAWFIAFAVSFFLAVGTKFNILFLPFVIIPWLFMIRKTPVFRKWFSKELVWYVVFFAVSEMTLFILLWPWLWENTLSRLIGLLGFYKDVGFSYGTGSTPLVFWKEINPIGLILIIAKSPIFSLVFLVGSLFLIVKDFRSKGSHVLFLVLLWFLIPILRTLLPESQIFANLRQFAEVIVPFSILVGIGGVYLSTMLAKILKANPVYLIWLVLLIYFVHLSWITISYYPNQNSYFNSLVGGTQGAEKKGIFLNWQIQGSFDSPYKDAIDWLNIHAEKDARLAFLQGSMTAISPLLLRHDIRLGTYFSGAKQEGEYIIFIYNSRSAIDFSYTYLDRFVNPIYQVKLKGATLAVIWKNDPHYLKEKYKNK